MVDDCSCRARVGFIYLFERGVRQSEPQQVAIICGVQRIVAVGCGLRELHCAYVCVILGDDTSKLVEKGTSLFHSRKSQEAFLDPGEQCSNRVGPA